MNDLVVLSLNNVNQVAVSQTAVVPYQPSLPSNNPNSSGQQNTSSDRRALPEAYAPDLVNPNIPYPELVGGASGFSPYYGSDTGQTPQSPQQEPRDPTPYPSAYEAVSETYKNATRAADWTVGTTLNLEV